MISIDRFLITYLHAVVGCCVTLFLWMIADVSLEQSVTIGVLSVLSLILMRILFYHRSASSSDREQVRVRIADLDEKIAESEKNTEKYRTQLRLLQEDPRFCFSPHNQVVEKRLMDTIETLDRELEPKLKKRAKLHAELDDLLQKKGYRGI